MAYRYKRPIDIDYTKVAETLTDFPVWIDITSNDLKHVSEGGKVQSASGYDIAFYSDENLTTPLKWELPKYDPETGNIKTNVKVPSVSHTVNTRIWMAYGDSGISTFQSVTADVWTNGYVAVYHLAHDGSTLDVTDATGNYHGTNSGAIANTSSPKLYGGATFDGTDDAIYGPYPVVNEDIFQEAITVSSWVYRTAGTRRSIVGRYPTTGNNQWQLDMSQTSNGRISAGIIDSAGSGFYSAINNGNSLTLNTWKHAAFTWGKNSDSGSIKIYVDGIEVNATFGAYTGNMRSSDGRWAIGQKESLSTDLFQGNQVEVRLANVRRSEDWLLAETNNQSSPGTFYSLGSETDMGGSRRQRFLII